MAENTSVENAEKAPVIDVKAEEKKQEFENISIPHPKGDCLFTFPKDSSINFMENAAYRLLTHLVYNRVNMEIAEQREVLKKNAADLLTKQAKEKEDAKEKDVATA